MKKFMISLALASFAMFSFAQGTSNEVVVPTVKHSVATNSFGSNWFVGVNGGVNIYNGVYMNGESAFDHLSPALNVYVGKWHTPGFGWRVAYQGLNVQSYEKFDHTAFMNFHFDALFNLSNMICGYREDRIWNVIPYVGVGWAGREGYNHEKGAGRMTSGDITGSLSANYGIMNTFRVAKRWAINLELAGFFFRNGFSGICGQSGHDMMWSANVGVTYKIGKVGWEPTVDLPALQAIYGGMIDGLNNQIAQYEAGNQANQERIQDLQDELAAKQQEIQDLQDGAFVGVTESVFFAFGSSEIASKKEMLNIEDYAKAAANANVKLRVIGFADCVGTNAYNDKLSYDRATAVAEALRSFGAVVDDVDVVGKGETEEYKDRSLNRRVIIEVIRK